MNQYFNNPFPIDAEFDGSNLQELHDSMFRCNNNYEDTTFKPKYNYTRDNRADELRLPHISIHAKSGELECRDNVFYRLYDCNIAQLTLADGCTIFIENCNIVKVESGTNCMIHIKQCDGLNIISNMSDNCMLQLDDCDMTALEITNNLDCSIIVRKGFLSYPNKTTGIDNEGFNTNKQFYAKNNEILNDTINGTNPPVGTYGSYSQALGKFITNNTDCFFELYDIDISSSEPIKNNTNCIIELKKCITTGNVAALTKANLGCFIDSIDCIYNNHSDHIHTSEGTNDYGLIRTISNNPVKHQSTDDCIISKLGCTETNGQYTCKGTNVYLGCADCTLNLLQEHFELADSAIIIAGSTLTTTLYNSKNTNTNWFSAYSNYNAVSENCKDSRGFLDSYRDNWNSSGSNINANQIIQIRDSNLTSSNSNIINTKVTLVDHSNLNSGATSIVDSNSEKLNIKYSNINAGNSGITSNNSNILNIIGNTISSSSESLSFTGIDKIFAGRNNLSQGMAISNTSICKLSENNYGNSVSYSNVSNLVSSQESYSSTVNLNGNSEAILTNISALDVNLNGNSETTLTNISALDVNLNGNSETTLTNINVLGISMMDNWNIDLINVSSNGYSITNCGNIKFVGCSGNINSDNSPIACYSMTTNIDLNESSLITHLCDININCKGTSGLHYNTSGILTLPSAGTSMSVNTIYENSHRRIRRQS